MLIVSRCGFVSLGINVCLCPLPELWAVMGSGYRLSVTLYVGSGFGCLVYLLVFFGFCIGLMPLFL